MSVAGGALCWGANAFGQVGDGAHANRPSPVQVSGLASGVTSLALGGAHTCALLTSGTVKCWGLNDSGQLGDGTKNSRMIPGPVTGLSGATELAAGDRFACARLGSGAVKCWGSNLTGELGNATKTPSTAPVDVVGLNSGVVAISASGGTTCALLASGTVKCWGYNDFGQLGAPSLETCDDDAVSSTPEVACSTTPITVALTP